MIDDSNAINELNDYLISVILEKEIHWSTGKLKGSGKSPSQTSKEKALKLIRMAVNPRHDEPNLTGRQRTEMKKRGKIMRALVSSGPKERPSVRSRGQSPQKERDANTVTGTLPKEFAGLRTAIDGSTVGGEVKGTNVGGKFGKLGKGTTGSKIRNRGVSGSTTTTLGVKKESCFDLISDLIEANPPKPNALQTIGKKHERRSGMTARSSRSKDGKSINVDDIWVRPDRRNQGDGSRYLEGLKRFSDNEGTPLKLKQAPEKGQEERLNKFYSKHGFEADKTKPGRYVRKPKSVNKGDNPAMKKSQSINSSYEYELNEKYVKANDPSGKGPDHRKPPEVRTRRPPTPDNEKYSEAEFDAAGKSPTTRKRKDTIRPAVGGKQYNEELIARFRNRIDEAMSPRFSRTTPAKAAARIGTVIKQLEAKPESATQTPEPTVRRSKISLSNIKIADDPTSGRGRRR